MKAVSFLTTLLLHNAILASPKTYDWKILENQVIFFQSDWRNFSESLKRTIWSLNESAGLYYILNPRKSGHKAKFDMILTSKTLEKAILISINVKISAHLENQYFQFEKGFLVYKRIQGTQVGMFFYGYVIDEIDEILSKYYQKITKKMDSSNVSRSIASEMKRTGQREWDRKTRIETELDILGENFKACYIEGVPEGISSATIKPFTMAWSSVVALLKSPAAWWIRSVDQWVALVNSIREFRLSEAYKAYSTLPSKDKTKIMCSLFSGVGVSGVVAKVAQRAALNSSQIIVTKNFAKGELGQNKSIKGPIFQESNPNLADRGPGQVKGHDIKSNKVRVFGFSDVSSKIIERLRAVELTVKEAIEEPFIGRTGTLTRVLKSENIVPKNGVIHIVGAAWDSAEEWAIPLMVRNDTKLVLSQHGDLVKYLGKNIQDQVLLARVWDQINNKKEYLVVRNNSHIKTLRQFIKETQSRISVNQNFESLTFQNAEGVIRPQGNVIKVPKADLMIMNQPMLDSGIKGKINMSSSEIFNAVKAQMKTETGVLWVNTESAVRIGEKILSQPKIILPSKRMHFENGGLPMHSKTGSYDFTSETYLLFFP